MDKYSSFYRWNLENTTMLIANKFPEDCVLLVKAARQKNFGFKKNLFENFVRKFVRNAQSCFYAHNISLGSDYCGDGIYQVNVNALLHLKLLVEQASGVKYFDLSKISHIKLVGFSQGTTALNQLVYSLYALNTVKIGSLHRFASLIEHVFWLDGGRCWITDQKVLQVLEERCIRCHIAVTPFQVDNPERLENRTNFLLFKKHLQTMTLQLDHKLYFENQKPSIEMHFKLLDIFAP